MHAYEEWARHALVQAENAMKQECDSDADGYLATQEAQAWAAIGHGWATLLLHKDDEG